MAVEELTNPVFSPYVDTLTLFMNDGFITGKWTVFSKASTLQVPSFIRRCQVSYDFMCAILTLTGCVHTYCDVIVASHSLDAVHVCIFTPDPIYADLCNLVSEFGGKSLACTRIYAVIMYDTWSTSHMTGLSPLPGSLRSAGTQSSIVSWRCWNIFYIRSLG